MPFNPESTFTKNSSLFGMPSDPNSKLHIIPTPWEPTASFKKGTVLGPKALFKASKQMDLFHPYFKKVYEQGIYWDDTNLNNFLKLNQKASPLCASVRNSYEEGLTPSLDEQKIVNSISDDFNDLVYQNTLKILKKNKTPALIGGDHSSPFGLIKALSEKYNGDFSIVHIDAHFDLRDSYQGFKHSHASIMRNVLYEVSKPPKIFQLGIRDFSESEFKLAQKETTFALDQEVQKELLSGKTFKSVLNNLFQNLTKNIYISFDIDGLSPEFCPNTGTVVPGGLSYSQAIFMIQHLHSLGHNLIGFDLVEVSTEDNKRLGEGLDETIGVRLLYELCCFALSKP